MSAHLLRALVLVLCMVAGQLASPVAAPAAGAALAPVNTSPTALGIAESNLYFMTADELATAM